MTTESSKTSIFPRSKNDIEIILDSPSLLPSVALRNVDSNLNLIELSFSVTVVNLDTVFTDRTYDVAVSIRVGDDALWSAVIPVNVVGVIEEEPAAVEPEVIAVGAFFG